MKRPFIGISGSQLRDDHGSFVDLQRSYVNLDYVRSIESQGGVPVIIPLTLDEEVISETIARLDGLLLSGGHDIFPLNYGEEPLQGLEEVWPERDQFDFMLLKAAMEKEIPILGICRGHQIVNVYMGGTLYQDLKYDSNCTLKHVQNQTPSMAFHTIDIERESKMAQLIGSTTWVTNSHHHQMVHRLGEGLKVTAVAKDGVVEGLEGTEYPWLVTCQFHPEMMINRSTEAKSLFNGFIEACSVGMA